jgi:hypothetical protein
VPPLSRILWVGPLTVLASIAAVVAVQLLAVVLLSPPSRFALLGQNLVQIQALRRSSVPIIFTGMLVSVAVLVFAIVCREAIHPLRTYNRIALAVLLVSFIPDVAAAMSSAFGWPLAMVFMVMHVAAWVPCVTILSKLSGARP